jgi:hypothetical protein
MKKSSNALTAELTYLWYSKAAVVLLLVALIACGLYMRTTYVGLETARDEYLQARVSAESQGEDPDEALSMDLNVRTQQSGATTITEVDNPVRWKYEELGRALGRLSPTSLIAIALAAATFIIGPFLFGCWGVFVGSFDFASKTIKVKAPYFSWRMSVLGKVCASFMVVVLVVLVCALVAWCAGALLSAHARGMLADADIQVAATTTVSSASSVAQAAVSMLVGWLFAGIGLFFGLILRGNLIAYVVIVLYNLLVPRLGVYDLKNFVLALGQKYFVLPEGMLAQPKPISLTVVFLLVFAVLALSVGASVGVSARQSTYAV